MTPVSSGSSPKASLSRAQGASSSSQASLTKLDQSTGAQAAASRHGLDGAQQASEASTSSPSDQTRAQPTQVGSIFCMASVSKATGGA